VLAELFDDGFRVFHSHTRIARGRGTVGSVAPVRHSHESGAMGHDAFRQQGHGRGLRAANPPTNIATTPPSTPANCRKPNSVASPIPITSASAEISTRTAPAVATTMPRVLRDISVLFVLI
jgi:hypothetical protein